MPELLPAAFHFAAPFWLWGLVLLPLLWVLYGLFYREAGRAHSALRDFADPHLLPHLMAQADSGERGQRRIIRALALWSLIWLCGLLAMAGPRWDYTEVRTFAPARNIVLLLDLSRSMDAQDIKPSRLVRARQEIEDILNTAEGVNTALIAFASIPHLITPLTDDRQTAARLLPSLETGLVYTQGSYLVPALTMAGELFAAAPPNGENHIVIFSDGGFDDGDGRIREAQEKLRRQGVQIHVMATGTVEGAPIPGPKDTYIRHQGTTVITRLERARLERIVQDGGGLYLEAEYLDRDTQKLLARVQKPGASEQETGKVARLWEERYYIFLLPLILLPLPWFRRRAAFPVLLLLLTLSPGTARAQDWSRLFLNSEQQGRRAIEQGEYDNAAQIFSDPYRRGVAQYRAGDYEAAADSFAEAARPEITGQARYNLGNAQLMAGKIEQAIETYEALLAADPDHADARHNLEIAKKLLQQQQQQNQNGQQDQKQDQSDQGSEEEQKQDQNQGGAKDRQEGQHDKEQEQQEEKEQADSGESEQEKQDQEEREQQGQNRQAARSQKDIDADQWLNRLESDSRSFLRNKFYIESQRANAKQGENPW